MTPLITIGSFVVAFFLGYWSGVHTTQNPVSIPPEPPKYQILSVWENKKTQTWEAIMLVSGKKQIWKSPHGVIWVTPSGKRVQDLDRGLGDKLQQEARRQKLFGKEELQEAGWE